MYKEHIMDHYKHPRNNAALKNPTISHSEKNPSCGDSITVDISITDNVIDAIGFTGEGCAISMAAASMLFEDMQSMSVDDVLTLTREDMLEMIGIPLTTMRVKCGMLALHAVKKALYTYKARQGEDV